MLSIKLFSLSWVIKYINNVCVSSNIWSAKKNHPLKSSFSLLKSNDNPGDLGMAGFYLHSLLNLLEERKLTNYGWNERNQDSGNEDLSVQPWMKWKKSGFWKWRSIEIRILEMKIYQSNLGWNERNQDSGNEDLSVQPSFVKYFPMVITLLKD